jgi:hypothetical protein
LLTRVHRALHMSSMKEAIVQYRSCGIKGPASYGEHIIEESLHMELMQ